ncbi:hypothetical protein MRX96_017350 [Rhipicephalus microplus]
MGLSDVFENETLDYSHELNTVPRSIYFSLVGDLFDLEQVLERKKDFHSIAQILACSALVKVMGDCEDIYISHDTWFLYRGMLRIHKRYIFPWHYTAHTTGVERINLGHTITMSSYAGKLVSWDNFYLTSAGLAITETLIVNDNKDLWNFVVLENGPFTWVSTAVASRLATSGLEWVQIHGRKNGGTYNDFKNDPLSRCNCSPPYNPTYAVAPRYDLIDPRGVYDIPEMYPRVVGGIDVKATNYTLFASQEFVGVNGPTWENQPPFQWSNSGFPDSQVGHPAKWQFEPVIHRWAEPRVKWSYKLQPPTNSAASCASWTIFCMTQVYAASSVWNRLSP